MRSSHLPVVPIRPRPGRRRFGARARVLAVLALLAAGAYMPSPLYPDYQRSFGFSDLSSTALYATYAVVSVPALLLLGPLGDRLSPRLVLRAGVAVAAAGTVCLAVADGFGALVAGRAAYGLALGAVTGVGLALVGRPARPGGHTDGAAATTAAGATAFVAGSAAGPALTGVLAQYAPAGHLLPYAVQLALLVAAFHGLRVVEPVARPTAASIDVGAPRGDRRTLITAAGTGFLGWCVAGLFLGLVPTLVQRATGVRDLALAGAVSGAVLIFSATTTPLVSRLGPRRAQVAGLAAALVPLVVLAAGARSPAAIAAAAVVGGLAHGLLFGGATASAAAAAPAGRASATAAAVSAAFYVGAGLPALVAGLLSTVMSLGTATATVALAAIVLGATLLPRTLRLPPTGVRTSATSRTKAEGQLIVVEGDATW